MKKINETFLIIIGILLFIVSYIFDHNIDIFFRKARLPFLDLIFSIVTNFGFVVVVALIIPSLIMYKKSKKFVYLIWITFIIAFALNFIIKLIFHRQRPIENFSYPFVSILNYSFPSMHSFVVFALLPALIKFFPKQKYFWIAFGILIAFTRVYFSFHFLSDVVFGALAGYLVGKIILGFYDSKKYKTK